MQRSEFQLDVTEEPPTTDQLRSIFEYVGEFKCGQLLEGSRNATEAMKILKQSPDSFRRPVVSLTFSDNSTIRLILQIVDWNNGRAGIYLLGITIPFH